MTSGYTVYHTIGAHFGPEKRALADAFLRLQALLRIKTKAAALDTKRALKAGLKRQDTTLRLRMEAARRTACVYCMNDIVSVFPT